MNLLHCICEPKDQNLDIQYTVGIASGVPVTFISVGEESQDDLDGFLDIVNFLQFKTDPPQVLTISYGFNEDELSSALAKSVLSQRITVVPILNLV